MRGRAYQWCCDSEGKAYFNARDEIHVQHNV